MINLKEKKALLFESLALFFIFLIFYEISLYDLRLFHSLADLFGILIILCLFTIVWNSHDRIERSYLFFLGIAYVFVGVFDLLHLISYEGMNLLPEANTNLFLQFWINARYLESFSLLTATFFVSKFVHGKRTVIAYLLLTIFFAYLIFSSNFPICYVEGAGVTDYKIYSEHIISIIFLLSIFMFYKKRELINSRILNYLIVSIIFSILAELSFTIYADLSGSQIFTGHVLKVGAFYFMYKAIVVSSIQIPQEALFNNLKRSKEQAQNYLNIAGSMFIAIDETRRITLANKKAEEVLGYSQDELIGLNWFDNFIPERTKSDILRIFNELMDGNTETNRTIETSIVTKEGEERTIRWQNSVLKDQNGKIIGTLSSGEDVTIQNKARNMLIASKLEAEAANRTKSEFLANMSHELRTPLNSIIGFSEVLLMKKTGELNEKQTHYANNVVKSGKHLLELINDVLDLSKIEAGKMSFEPENISLPEVLDEVQLLMTPLAYKKSIHLRFSIEFIDIRIFAEKIKFKGILYNLLSNAIKFTPENGRVCVNAKIAEDKVQISVSDTGIGIPEEKLRYIFEPFRQVDSSTSRQYGGTGLGLTLVKKYVEMHGGDIWVESKCGEGSTFSFTIPLNENP